MKIKIIDLLNTSKNELPSKIKAFNTTFEFIGENYYATTGDYKDTNLLEWIHAVDDLNDEVEIIEEEKEIEKIDISENATNRNERYIRKYDNEFLNLSQVNYYLAQKINELVDEINKLKKEKNREDK